MNEQRDVMVMSVRMTTRNTSSVMRFLAALLIGTTITSPTFANRLFASSLGAVTIRGEHGKHEIWLNGQSATNEN